MSLKGGAKGIKRLNGANMRWKGIPDSWCSKRERAATILRVNSWNDEQLLKMSTERSGGIVSSKSVEKVRW